MFNARSSECYSDVSMNKAFTKETDCDDDDDARSPRQSACGRKNYITPQGYAVCARSCSI